MAKRDRTRTRANRLDKGSPAPEQLRDGRDWNGDVVLDTAALELLRLRETFAQPPDVAGLRQRGGNRRVGDETLLGRFREQLLERPLRASLLEPRNLNQGIPRRRVCERGADRGRVLHR